VIGLDTNVLVRYIMRDDPRQTEQADAIVASLSARDPGHVTPIVLAELWWVFGRSYHVTRTRRCDLFAALLETDQLKFEAADCAGRALAQARQGADFADALVAAMNQAAGCRATVTFDRSAARRAGMSEASSPIAPAGRPA
jgi:predicted nucleic-acid-binding protein